jgi:hypothetical protein
VGRCVAADTLSFSLYVNNVEVYARYLEPPKHLALVGAMSCAWQGYMMSGQVGGVRHKSEFVCALTSGLSKTCVTDIKLLIQQLLLMLLLLLQSVLMFP